MSVNRKFSLDSCDSALRHITPAHLPASHCLLNSKQKVGKTESPDLLGRLGFAPRGGAGGGRKPPIQFTSEELKQSSQKDVAKEAEGSAAMGDDLCAWQGAGEREVGEVAENKAGAFPVQRVSHLAEILQHTPPWRSRVDVLGALPA